MKECLVQILNDPHSNKPSSMRIACLTALLLILLPRAYAEAFEPERPVRPLDSSEVILVLGLAGVTRYSPTKQPAIKPTQS